MGGYFIGRPMDPESRPAKTKKAKSRVALTWAGDKPTKPHDGEETCQKGVQVQPGVLTWKAKT